MKILGLLFLCIAGYLGIQGQFTTGEASYLALQEEQAAAEVERVRDGVRAYTALATANSGDILRIRGKELRDHVMAQLKKNGASDPVQTLPYLVSAEHDVSEAQARHRRAVADREGKMKWHYGPAACLAVVGLILVVVPARQTRR